MQMTYFFGTSGAAGSVDVLTATRLTNFLDASGGGGAGVVAVGIVGMMTGGVYLGQLPGSDISNER